MMGPLEAPRSADDLYLARSVDVGGVSTYRPVMTGDIFRGIDIPGIEHQIGDDEAFAMVVSHPCSMREGALLGSHVQVVRVLKCDPITIDAWSKLYYDRFPLPNLTVVVDPDDITSDDPAAELATRIQEGAYAAFLDLRGRVRSTALRLDGRICCLTEQGIAFLHQRMSHNDTRFAPEVDDLVAACAPVLSEVELWEQWNERLVDPAVVDDPTKLQSELDRLAKEFDREMSKRRSIPGKRNGFYTLRGDLSIPKRAAAARRELLRTLQDRSEALSYSALLLS